MTPRGCPMLSSDHVDRIAGSVLRTEEVAHTVHPAVVLTLLLLLIAVLALTMTVIGLMRRIERLEFAHPSLAPCPKEQRVKMHLESYR